MTTHFGVGRRRAACDWRRRDHRYDLTTDTDDVTCLRCLVTTKYRRRIALMKVIQEQKDRKEVESTFQRVKHENLRRLQGDMGP